MRATLKLRDRARYFRDDDLLAEVGSRIADLAAITIESQASPQDADEEGVNFHIPFMYPTLMPRYNLQSAGKASPPA
jgi:hypothetical protein